MRVVFLRKAGTPAEDPELLALPPQAQAMVREGLEQVRGEADAARLREVIAQLQQAAEQAPEETKPAFAYLLRKAEEHLASLTGDKQ